MHTLLLNILLVIICILSTVATLLAVFVATVYIRMGKRVWLEDESWVDESKKIKVKHDTTEYPVKINVIFDEKECELCGGTGEVFINEDTLQKCICQTKPSIDDEMDDDS